MDICFHGMLAWPGLLKVVVLFKEIRCQILNRCLLSACELNFFSVWYYGQVRVNFHGDSKNPH